MDSVGKHVLIYGLGIVLGRVIGFLMLPVYTRYLTPADYGVMELIQMTLDIVSVVAGGQIALGIFRYYYKAGSQREKDAVVATALLALGLSYALVSTGTFAASDLISRLVFDSSEHTRLIRIASVALFFQSLIIVPLAFTRMRERSVLFVTVNAVKLVIGLVLNLVFLIGLNMGVEAIFMSNLIASACVGITMTVIVLREVGLSVSRQATRDLLRYGVPLIGVHVANFLTTFGDRYFLQSAGNSTIVGLYTLAYQFGFLLAMIGTIPFEQVWEPKRFEIAKRPDRDDLLAKGFIYMNVLTLTAGVGIALFVGDLLRVMSTPAFHAAAHIVPIILIAYVFQAWTALQDIGILIREKTEFATLGHWCGALVALVSYAILIPRYLGWGAAIGTVLAFGVRHLVIYGISQRLWPVRYRWAPVLRLIGAAVATVLGGILLPDMGLFESLGARTLLLAAYLVAVWNLDILSASDRRQIREIAGTLAAGIGTRIGRIAPSQ